MSHDPKAIELGWVVEEHSPSVSGLTVTATPGQSRIAAYVVFTDQDPVVLHFEGANATAQLFGWLDFTITNNSGVSWTEFNISAIDTFVEPPTTSFPPMAPHPFHSHFHDANLTQNSATNPVFSGPSQFSRLGYTTILDRNEAVAPNSWEFTGGTFGSGATEQWTNFRIHQYELDDRMINMTTVVSGGSFDVILTPNESHIDYNGYVITEDEQNTNSLSGDAPVIPGGTPIPRLDLMFGYEGKDTINAGALNDLVYGGAGDDAIDGGTGNDHLHGGAGDDTFKGGPGNDTVDGGAGNIDTLVLPGAREDYTFQLLSITSNEWSITGPDGGDLTTGVEFFQFNTLRFSAADIILGNPGTPITPPGGTDVRNGGNGDDALIANFNAFFVT